MASTLKLLRNGAVGFIVWLGLFAWLIDAVDSQGRNKSWIADAHRDGKRFVVRAEDKLTAFLELEATLSHSDGEGADSAAGVGAADKPECD